MDSGNYGYILLPIFLFYLYCTQINKKVTSKKSTTQKKFCQKHLNPLNQFYSINLDDFSFQVSLRIPSSVCPLVVHGSTVLWSETGKTGKNAVPVHISLKNNNFKVGINGLSNRFYLLNNKIPLEWLNLSLNTFKVKCKKLLLPY